jgi:alkyldihydroxyacetonephosphate synthase
VSYAVWGWGAPSEEPPTAELEAAAPHLQALLGFGVLAPERPAPLATLPAPRVLVPSSLEHLVDDDPAVRARHGLGRSYRDLIRGLRGAVPHVPDHVLRPRDESDVTAVLDWCGSAGVAVVPFGGGTSVVGGVEPDVGERWPASVSLDLGRLDRVLDVDTVSRAARIQAGTLGPALENQLRSTGLTLRFFPQSFERSTLGGWIATRAAGHYATRLTHIDDVVESITAITPTGRWESRRLPGSGAGPSPDRMLLGSEGTLGVVTEAWVRLQPRPTHRAGASVAFDDFLSGAHAVRTIVQSGLDPAQCRLVDADEARLTGALSDGRSLLVLGVESAHRPLDDQLAAAVEICRGHGGEVLPRSGASAQWGETFKAAPRLRDRLVLLGVLSETFETAITWDRFEEFVASVRSATEAAVRTVAGAGVVSCRLTHAYADGAAPYFTVLAPARRGSELAQWREIKLAASEAILAGGGTITHHHAVGRDQRQGYDRQRPDAFAAALRGAKAALDPTGMLNPGVLLD